MRGKALSILAAILLCGCCFASGWLCRERAQVWFEHREAVMLAAQAQWEAAKMLVRGTVISVLPSSVRLQTDGGTKDLRTFYYTVVVIGNKVQNQPGEVDLTKFFWIGDKVIALTDRQNRLLWIRKKQ